MKHRHTLRIPLKQLMLLLVAIVFCAGSFQQTVLAGTVRPDDLESIIDETTFYDIVPLGTCGGGSQVVNMEGRDNVEKAWNFFKSKGLSSVQVAGIIGNLRQESGMNPKSVQSNGGPGRGIAQWSVGERWVDLQKWAENNLPDKNADKANYYLTIEAQLLFIWHEMNDVKPWDQTLPELKKTDGIEDITDARGRIETPGSVRIFEEYYEKAGKPVMENRIKYAKEALAAYGGSGDTPNTAADGSSCGSAVLVNGYSFPVGPRTKRDYSTLPCTNSHSYTDKFGNRATANMCHHDGSPAFDLMYNGVEGQPIYALTTVKVIRANYEYVMDSSRGGKSCNAIQLQAQNDTDKSYYWYGHVLLNPGIKANDTFDPGVQIGKVATPEYGPRCWGGGPHLHIDRGCKDKAGNWQKGGNDNCRDPGFMADLQKIWEALPSS